jgi:hypothetical protein
MNARGPACRLLGCLLAVAAIGSGMAAERPFSEELAPYPIQPSAQTRSVDDILQRTTTAANRVSAGVTACRTAIITMYRTIGIDPSAERTTLRRYLPTTWSHQTPQPLSGAYPQPFSIDCPMYHAIPATSPRVLLPEGYVTSCHVATIGAHGDGWGIGVVIGTAKDPLRRIVQTWDRDEPRKGDREFALHVPDTVGESLPRNTGDRHLVIIDAATASMATTWHAGIHGELLTGWRAYGPYPLGSLGVGEGTNAAQISDLAGLLRAGEASNPTKPIPHALFGPSRKFWKAIVYPAINWDEWVGASDGGQGVVPYGGVIQLDPHLDLGQLTLSLPARRILEAIQRYGWYLHDTGVRDVDIWSCADGDELGQHADDEIRGVLASAHLYLVPAPAKYQAPYPHGPASSPHLPGESRTADAATDHTHDPAPAERPPEVLPEFVRAWDERLFRRLRAEVGRTAVPFHLTAFPGDALLTVANEDGTLTLHLQGGDIAWSWARLGTPERQSLVEHLHVAGPEDHCLVAFYLLQQGRRDEARLHLAQGGEGAAEVGAAFK